MKCCTHGCEGGWPYKQRPSHELRNTGHPDLRDYQALLLLPITSSHSSLSLRLMRWRRLGESVEETRRFEPHVYTPSPIATEGRGWPGKQPCRAMQPSISCRSNHCPVYTTLQYDLFPLCRHRKTRRLIKISHGP